MPPAPDDANSPQAAPSAAPLTVAAWLEDQEGGIHPVGPSITIGRAIDNQLSLADLNVSRYHALVHCRGEDELSIIDLDSRNGTFVNGRRLNAPCTLHDGDRIAVGGMSFVFHRIAAAPHSTNITSAIQTLPALSEEPCVLLLADLRGFSQLAQRLSAAELTTTVGGWIQSCRTIIEEQGGAVDKYLGDGFLAWWPGAPGKTRGPVRALRMLSLLRMASTVDFRCAVHHGQTPLGAAMTRGEQILPCRTVAFAFRMERLAAALEEPFLISAAARAYFGEALEAEPLSGAHPVRGFPGDHTFFSLASTGMPLIPL